ncbi:DUF2637 domain-containing protein [Streptomyces sp. NPDC013178]|uniref:DUF2637 domain-containing protein n=1 Tax=Streptomyces sp. NPDC013178 TaxID=3155118 RepID=UPI0033EB4FB6
MHRILIRAIVAGALIIAGIGFAGSYGAVRQLAVEKGFRSFSHLFPIGIDAGICVLLALDLLLTWIGIPFPLLRQTAWLLTAATIAFNAAAAWPDPLGVGMHAVIPLLFVVTVEAARHAIGRIADITADKRMERVRLTRWFLSPLRTFLLWRRMKLWELHSYEQVIKLEQQRLAYQARLRSRYGRSWRRKAPVESLMPLRLAKYGVPLAQTAPAGLAAAGLPAAGLNTADAKPPTAPTPRDTSFQDTADDPSLQAREVCHEQKTQPNRAHPLAASAPMPPPDPPKPLNEAVEQFAGAYQEFIAQFRIAPTAEQWALWLHETYRIPTADGPPLPQEQIRPVLKVLERRYAPHAEKTPDAENPPPANQSSPNAQHAHQEQLGASPNTNMPAAHDHQRYAITNRDSKPITSSNVADLQTRLPPHKSANSKPCIDPTTAQVNEHSATDTLPLTQHTAATPADKPPTLTKSDRYYLAWIDYQAEHAAEPSPEQLSAYLATRGMHGRSGKPVSPANLRRYLLPYRIYNVWAEHRQHNKQPSLDAIAKECAARKITAQYNKPITTHHLTQHTTDFERRWQTLNHQRSTPYQNGET